MSADIKWMMCSDVHFPLHSKRHVSLFMKVMKSFKPHAVDLLGDIDNADTTSRWADGTSQETAPIEDEGVKDTRDFLMDIRKLVGPDTECHFHDGNHGWTRHESYLDKKAPTFLGFVTPDTLYEYSRAGFEWHRYDEPPVKRFGDMYAHHGESISKHAGESVRNDCLNWGVSLIRGHSHRIGQYNKTWDLTGQRLRGYEIGHLCDTTKMDYCIAKDWQPGFAIAHIFDDKPHIQVIQIHDNTCVVDGKRFAS